MLGAIVGDIIGSYYEAHPTKDVGFELFPVGAHPTDDTVMTLAVAEWLMEDADHTHEGLVCYMRKWGRKFPNAGYGALFEKWLLAEHPKPYGSYGNGSAMRVSPVGLYSSTLEEAVSLARISAEVTHNHPEGIKGAEALAASVWMAKNGKDKTEIREYIEDRFGYDLGRSIVDMRKHYVFDATCQGSVPQAIRAYIESDDFESAIRLAVSLGGDADTLASMAGAIAAATSDEKYMINKDLERICLSLMHGRMINGMYAFLHFLKHPVLDTPIRNSFKVDERVYAGEYPATSDEVLGRRELARFIDFGITHFVDLTEKGELVSYSQWLPKNIVHIRCSIKDCGVPSSLSGVAALVKHIMDIVASDKNAKVYIHCRGGIGRTGTVVGCYYASCLKDFNLAYNLLQKQFSACPKSAYRKTPETMEQKQFIMRFADYVCCGD